MGWGASDVVRDVYARSLPRTSTYAMGLDLCHGRHVIWAQHGSEDTGWDIAPIGDQHKLKVQLTIRLDP